MSEITDLIGKPFSEMKCWDLVQEYYRRNGKSLPDYRELLTADGTPDGHDQYQELEEPEIGCICIYSIKGQGIDHAGVYLGNNQLLHATEGGVCIERFSKFLPRLKGMYK